MNPVVSYLISIGVLFYLASIICTIIAYVQSTKTKTDIWRYLGTSSCPDGISFFSYAFISITSLSLAILLVILTHNLIF